MAGSTVKLTFQVDDNGTVRVIDDANAKLKESTEAVTRLDRSFSALKVSAAATVAAVGAAGAAAGAVVKQQIDQIDEIGLLARNLGLTAKELSSLTVSAQLANVSIEDVGRSVAILSSKIVDARRGGANAKLFEDLGIDVSSGRTATQVLLDVADAIAGMNDGFERTATARELFGRGGVPMIEMLTLGSDAIRAQIAEAERMGLVFDDLSAATAGLVNDALDRLYFAVQGTAREVTIALLPAIEQAATSTTNWAVQNRDVLAADLAQWAKDTVDPIIRLAEAVKILGAGIGVVAEAYGMLETYILDPAADLLVTGAVQAYYNPGYSTTANAAQERVRRRGLTASDLAILGSGDPTAGMTSMDGMSVDAPLAGVSGGVSPMAVERATRAVDGLRASVAGVAAESRATRTETDALAASINQDLAFALGKIEQGTVLDEYFQELPAVAEEASIQVADSFVEELERAEVAVIDLGDLLGDSLTSAVDNLIASGKFNLADVFVATGRTVVSRMVSGVLQETLQFPTIPTDLTSLFRSSAGASRVAQAGTVTGGSYGAGMSFDASGGGFMTDAATGAAVFVPSATSAPASGASFGQFFGAGLGGLALGSSVSSIAGNTSSESMAGSGIGGLIGAGLGAFGGPLGSFIGATIGSFMGGFVGDLFVDKPNKDQATRMALDEAFKGGGIFPTLALAQEPPDWFKYVGFPGGPAALNTEARRRIASQGEGPANRWFDSLLSSGQIRPAVQPSFMGGFSSEIEALGVLLGLEGSQVDEKVGRNLGIRADVLGISESQFDRELKQVARSVTTLDEALKELNFSFLRNAIDGKDAAFTQEQYNERFRGMVELLAGDLPAGVDAVAIALRNMDQLAGATVVNIEDAIEAIEQASQVASGLQSGIRGAGTSAVSGLLTGSVTSSADFRRSVLNSAVGAIGENALNSITRTGAFSTLMESLTSGILGNDPAAVSAALANVPGAFDQIQDAIERFIPLFDELAESIDGGAAAAARQGRSGVVATIDRLMFSTMTPAQQQAELRRRIADSRSTVAGIIGDDLITAGERSAFDRNIGSLTSDAEALFGMASQYAAGSPMNRALRGEALDALRFAESAWDVAISTATVGDMNVQNVNVAQLIVDTRSAAGLLTKAAETPEGKRAIQQAAGLGG